MGRGGVCWGGIGWRMVVKKQQKRGNKFSAQFSRSLKETAFCPADLFHSLVTDGINYAAQDTGE